MKHHLDSTSSLTARYSGYPLGRRVPSERRGLGARYSRREVLFLLAIAVALGIGLALASPVVGAELHQADAGNITGTVTVSGQSAAGLTVELRQRSNAGNDTLLAATTTNETGTYSFPNQPSAPNDAFYYVRFGSGKGTLAAWYTFPIIYVIGSAFTVPSVDLSDVELVEPAQGATLPLPANLVWKARRSGENYRVFVYAAGKTDKAVLDSGSLGTSTQFAIPQGALPEGAYEAVVQVRDAVVGYGQSQARFTFSIGKASTQSGEASAPEIQQGEQPQGEQPAEAPANPTVAQPPAEPQPATDDAPALELRLSGSKTSVDQGGEIVYTIEVVNKASSPVSGVVITDKLPAGVTADAAGTKSTDGSVSVQGDTVKAEVGSLAPNQKAVVEIPASVGQGAGSNISNQASALYDGASDPVQSNAYIAQVAEPVSGPPPSQPQAPQANQPQQPSGSQPSGPAANPPAEKPAAPRAENPQAPRTNPPAGQVQQPAASQPQKQQASQPQKPASAPQQKPAAQPRASQPAASIPQTGGAFPVVFALFLVLSTLLARYLRGRGRRV